MLVTAIAHGSSLRRLPSHSNMLILGLYIHITRECCHLMRIIMKLILFQKYNVVRSVIFAVATRLTADYCALSLIRGSL